MIETKIDGTRLTPEEITEVNAIMSELYSPKAVSRNTGKMTRRILEIRGVVSPPTNGATKVSDKPNTWIVTKHKSSSIDDIKKKYKLK